MTRSLETIRADIAKVSKEPCGCVRCSLCGGTGRLRWSRPLCVESWKEEPCEDCNGGITQICGRCQLLTDLDHEMEEAS